MLEGKSARFRPTPVSDGIEMTASKRPLATGSPERATKDHWHGVASRCQLSKLG
jgi:hypothetical protein